MRYRTMRGCGEGGAEMKIRFTAVESNGLHVKVRVAAIYNDGGSAPTLGFLTMLNSEWQEFKRAVKPGDIIEVVEQT